MQTIGELRLADAIAAESGFVMYIPAMVGRRGLELADKGHPTMTGRGEVLLVLKLLTNGSFRAIKPLSVWAQFDERCP